MQEVHELFSTGCLAKPKNESLSKFIRASPKLTHYIQNADLIRQTRIKSQYHVN